MNPMESALDYELLSINVWKLDVQNKIGQNLALQICSYFGSAFLCVMKFRKSLFWEYNLLQSKILQERSNFKTIIFNNTVLSNLKKNCNGKQGLARYFSTTNKNNYLVEIMVQYK